jgi:N6-adenosine-specific RNA methylase IME4
VSRTPFRVIVADPPWKFGDKLPGRGRGAAKHYETMTAAEIADIVVGRSALALCRRVMPIADDALLFLWRVSAMVEEALSVVRAWGFVPKTELVWRKLTASGKRWFGMGRTLRAEHETCIVATRGRPTIRSHSVRSVFDAVAGRHSEKPPEFFELVERLSDGPYLELFARSRRRGWTTLGNQLT